MVATVTVSQPLTNGTEEYRYPRAGQANASSELCVVSFGGNPAAPPGPDGVHGVTRRLVPPLNERLPWVEYIVRAGWAEQGAITAPSLHHHCAITATSLRHHSSLHMRRCDLGGCA